MAVYSSKDFTFSIAGHDVTAYMTKSTAAKIAALLDESTAFGATWPSHVATGISQMADYGVGGLYDTTANALVALLNGQQGATFALVITVGGTKTFTFSAILESFTVTPVPKKVTMFDGNFRPTGTVTIA